MKRNRIGNGQNCTLGDNNVRAAIEAAAPLRLSITFDALKEKIYDEIMDYSTLFDLAPAEVSAQEEQRKRLKKAVGSLLTIARESKTQKLVELLGWWPASQALLKHPIPERIGSLPLDRLTRDLEQLSDALENCVFVDDMSCPNNDDPAFFLV